MRQPAGVSPRARAPPLPKGEKAPLEPPGVEVCLSHEHVTSLIRRTAPYTAPYT